MIMAAQNILREQADLIITQLKCKRDHVNCNELAVVV